MTEPVANQAYIAALWEHPRLCLACFGVQYQTREGQRLYEAAGIHDAMMAALEVAKSESLLLLNRPVMAPEGPLLIQYWRSYEDLDRWSHQLPHLRWWQWLVENSGRGVGFYHEIYQVQAAEAIYEPGTVPVGPAQFCSVQVVQGGEGRSRQRQQQFADAVKGREAKS